MPQIEVSEECLAKIKEQFSELELKEISNYEDLIGSKFYFRTVTFHLIGEVKKIVGRFAYLKGASWIADSGRFMNAIKDGTLSEVEPVGDAFINLDTVVDFFPWRHLLPTKQK
jgi:hypothetical protein